MDLCWCVIKPIFRLFRYFRGPSMTPKMWKSLIDPLFLQLRKNKWYQRIPCEKIRLPAPFKFVYNPKESVFSPIFVCFTYFWGGKNVFFDAITAILIVETRLNSARWRIASQGICLYRLFWRNGRNRSDMSDFPKKMRKKSRKGAFWPPMTSQLSNFHEKCYFRNLRVLTKILRYWKPCFGGTQFWTP